MRKSFIRDSFLSQLFLMHVYSGWSFFCLTPRDVFESFKGLVRVSVNYLISSIFYLYCTLSIWFPPDLKTGLQLNLNQNIMA